MFRKMSVAKLLIILSAVLLMMNGARSQRPASTGIASATSKTALKDLDRPLTPRDVVRVLNKERMSFTSAENLQRALPKQVGLVYKIKVDGQNNLYAIPSPLIGIDLPPDTFPVGKGVCAPCSWCNDKAAGGCCETFCYVLLEPDKSSLGVRADGDYFTPGIDKGDIDVFSIQQFGKGKVGVKVSGTLSEPQSIQGSGWCGCYVGGYGAVAFRHGFRGSCETACEVLNKWYKNTHQ